jgi:hypothetical protein
MQELITKLSQQLRIDEKQARGGAAILFKAAKDKLGEFEFNKLLGPVAGVDTLIRQAPRSGGGLLGGLASFAGGNTALIATIVSGFSKLHLSTDDAQKFVPIVLDYLRGQVGPDAVSILERTLRA